MEAIMRQWKVAYAFALALGACGAATPIASTTPTASTGALVITIQSLTFTPLNVDVAPGATVTVRNADGILHSLTSEAAMGNYSPGAVNGVSFDTGLFSTGDQTITIPANAAPGTVVPYFCRFHLSMMPQGTITVQTGATAPQSQTSNGSTSPMPGAY
jgi:plastocyanin